MISTVSLSFDLTYVDPLTGTVIPRCVVTDSTDYASIVDFDLVSQQAKGYGVLTFNGDAFESKSDVGNPLINLQGGDTTGFFNLPLDENGNVANGIYNVTYSLRLTEGSPDPVGIAGGTTATFSNNYWMLDFFEPGDSITLTPVLGGGSSQTRTVTAINQLLTNVSFTITPPITTFSGSARLTYDVANLQFSGTYAYSGCTQTSANVDFIYDCEYGNSGTWSVSNATVLGATEIVTSLNCVINYPSWTSSNPLFNPQVVTTVLPYPTLPGDNTPLATGTYSVSLSQQIQQTQASGLVVVYNNSVIKEFAVSCAGSLCGLIPCMENLRAAHAAELVRNRISKYQVFVDNVALYYIEAMNYRSCGELDKYRDTINLIQAQLDASGCDCACCDDNSYYWVSNNSANSIIDEILANFQFRLYTGPGAPSATEVGVELGALWQDTTTGILYRCTGDTPGNLTWALYYDPSVVYPTGGANGLSISGSDVVLGGSLDNDTNIDLNSYDLTFSDGNVLFSGAGSQKVTLSSLNTALQVNGGTSALIVEGSTNTLNVTATTSVAAFLEVNRAVNNTVATALSLRTTVDSGSGDDGIGTSIQFSSESSSGAPSTTASIESVLVSATTPVQANLNFKTRSNSSSALLDRLTLNPDGSATLHSYGDGTITGTPTYALGVDVDGNVIETNSILGASNGLTEFANNIELGGSLTKPTTINRGANDLTISGTTSSVSITGSDTSPSLSVSNSIGRAFSSQGVHSAGSAVLSTLDTSGSATTASPTLTVGALAFVPGNGFGSSIEFSANEPSGLYTGAMSSIRSTWQNAAAINSKLDITTTLAGVESTALTINPNASLTLPEYGSGTFTGTATRSLSVDSSGNVIETPLVKVFAAKVTNPSPGNYAFQTITNNTGGTITITYSVAGGSYTISSSNSAFTSDKTLVFATLEVGNDAIFTVFPLNTSQIIVQTAAPGGAGLDALVRGYIKIEIYP